MLAFCPERFSKGRAGDPLQRAETLFGSILAQGARLPSQRRFATRAKAEREGIVLSVDAIAFLERRGHEVV